MELICKEKILFLPATIGTSTLPERKQNWIGALAIHCVRWKRAFIFFSKIDLLNFSNRWCKTMSLFVYGIPTCNSCKKALKWLDQHSIPYTWVNTKSNPPSRSEIDAWISFIGSKPLRNTSGGSYRALGEEKKTWSDIQWASAFANDPMLLTRPLFTRHGRALFTGFRGSDEELKKKLEL